MAILLQTRSVVYKLFKVINEPYCNLRSISHVQDLVSGKKHETWSKKNQCWQRSSIFERKRISSCIRRTMSDFAGKDQNFIFRQLLDYKSFTYSYILGDPVTKEAIIIDPVIEMVERDARIIKDFGLELKYAVNTHVHADHVTGSGELKKKLPTCESMISNVSNAKADVKLSDGDKIDFGSFHLEVRSTPGHTNGCLTYVWHDKGMAFTGDALLVRGCGRTDFQEGNSETLYESVHKQIFSLPSNFRLFPAHDYTGQTVTTVAEEKTLNPRLTKSKAEFKNIMENLNLPYPKQIDKALPANMVCGLQDLQS
ncbi:persulfide dioxygenase ETHE1, mitochondrial-like isoform X1 [Mytilus californianus]|uniref:persulfide dioxygenase ETHE1, mitochondrial-like isoform X1 n=2 Tax=Mytilus californianus TaxID=6549 RepID=UPI002247E937|nr:persulfide dioxygenase ETHE1, mitochondrial-like isoform X1 [Mytilus californianus]